MISATSVSENDITITSDKDFYYCEPIFNDKGECLIKAKLTVTNNGNKNYNLDGETSFNIPLENTDYFFPDGKKAKKKSQGKGHGLDKSHGLDKIQLKKDESYEVYAHFWVKEAGKFNFTVNAYQLGNNNLLGTAILDPPFNASINSETPSWHLINGSLESDLGIYDYEAQINITSGISDDSDSTRYSTTIGSNNMTRFYYQFNDVDDSDAYDSSGNDNPLTIMPNADIVDGMDYQALQCTQTNGGGAKSLGMEEFNLGATDFTIGFRFNMTSTTSSSSYLMRHYEFPQGFYIYRQSAGQIRAFFRDSAGASNNIVSTTVANFNQIYSVVITRDVGSGNLRMYVNGVNEVNGSVSSTGNYTNYANLEIGSKSSSSGFNGYMDEVFLTEELWTDQQIQNYHNQGEAYNDNTGIALQVFYNHPIDTTNNYALQIKKYGTGTVPVRIYSMVNMTHTDQSSYIDSSISQGDNFVTIDSIISNGYNFPFRITNLHDSFEISDIFLYEVGNDTTPPTIYDCQVNDSFVDCNDPVTWSCHIYDDSFVASAIGVVNVVGTPHYITRNAVQNPSDSSLWEVKLDSDEIQLIFEQLNWSFDSYLNISFFQINATDVAGNTATNFTSYPWSIYGCIICEPIWSVQYDSCLTNDTQIKYYTDTQNCNNSFGLPGDNGTFVSCDYCIEDLDKHYTSECVNNGSYYVIDYIWVDNNYYSCCIFTSILEDCSVDFDPYISTYTEYCTFLEDDFEVDYDENVYFALLGNKVFWKFDINDTNNSYKCQSYIKTTSGNLIQTNPIYTQKTDTLITLRSTEYEDREYFQTHNGLGQVYFTEDQVVKDGRAYIFGVECSGNSQTLRSERLVHTFHEPVKDPVTRFFWLKDNIFAIVTLVVILVILGLALFALLRVVRR